MNFRSIPLFSSAVTLALGAGLTAILFSQAPAGPSLTLLGRDLRRTVPLTQVNDQELVGLDDLASAFQLSVQESLGAITVSYKGKNIILNPDQTLASVSGRLISLPSPPVRSGRRILVPVEFISRGLSPIYDARLELRKPSHLVIIGDLRVPRIVIRYDSLGSAGRLTIDATPPAASNVSQDNEHVTVKFDADALDVQTPLIQPLPPQAIVQSVRLVDAVTLGIDVVPRFGGLRSTSLPVDNTARLVLDLAPAGQTDRPSATTPATPPTPSSELPTFAPPTPSIRTIAIDPGHGGEDEGAKGANGAVEKDLTLAIGRRLRGALEARLGVRVLMTRDEDRNVRIDERTAVANNNKADLFVSLHVNSSLRKTTSGASIFFAAFDKDAAQAASKGGSERVPAYGGGMRDINMVPWDLAQTHHLDQSSAFAGILRQQLQNRVPLAATPADSAPLLILESANMPAVLVELGYLSNVEQEKLITGDGFQNAVVQAFYEAVVRFRDALASGGTR